MVAGGFRMPSDPKVSTRSRFTSRPGGGVVVIVVMLAIALFGAAYALGQEDDLLAVPAVPRRQRGRPRARGLFSWIGVIAQRNRRVIYLGAFAVAFLFPFTQNGSGLNMSIATQVLIFATTALGWTSSSAWPALGLGYIAFLGAGAYVSAMMSHSAFATIGWKPPFIVVVAIAACVSSILKSSSSAHQLCGCPVQPIVTLAFR